VFAPGRTFKSILMLVSKARSLSLEEYPKGALFRYAPALHTLSRLDGKGMRCKHSSLFGPFVNYGCKSFITLNSDHSSIGRQNRTKKSTRKEEKQKKFKKSIYFFIQNQKCWVVFTLENVGCG
jgi:hypothetical protein